MDAVEVLARANALPRYSLLGASVGVSPTPGTGGEKSYTILSVVVVIFQTFHKISQNKDYLHTHSVVSYK